MARLRRFRDEAQKVVDMWLVWQSAIATTCYQPSLDCLTSRSFKTGLRSKMALRVLFHFFYACTLHGTPQTDHRALEKLLRERAHSGVGSKGWAKSSTAKSQNPRRTAACASLHLSKEAASWAVRLWFPLRSEPCRQATGSHSSVGLGAGDRKSCARRPADAHRPLSLKTPAGGSEQRTEARYPDTRAS